MKTRPRFAAALILAVAMLAGCAAISKIFHPAKVAPGEDAVVVNAERAIRSAFVLVDNFVALDDANREQLAAQAPPVHAFAEQIRRTAPDTFRAAWSAVQAYKAAKPSPSTAEGDEMQRQLAAVEALAAQVRAMITSINQQGVKLKQPSGGGLPASSGAP